MPASKLALNIANEITQMINSGELSRDDHLKARDLAARFEVSRSPVREALLLLAEQGLVALRHNKGFFVMDPPTSPSGVAEPVSEETRPFETLNDYHRLAEDWLTDRIPSEVTELELRERYGLTKTQLNDILMRATREGWAERKQGYGWRLLPVAKTPEAFEQIYRLRMLIEPAAMLEPGFQIDRKILDAQRRIQERMLETDIERLPAERLLHTGSLFHEELIKMSGNPFFHLTLVRLNRMRRLLEYRSNVDRVRLTAQCRDHLQILDLLKAGEAVEASYAMRRHLGGALSRKSPVAMSWSQAKETA